MRKFLSLLLCLAMIVGLCTTAFVPTEAATGKIITLRLHDTNAYVNGSATTIDDVGTFPFTLNSSTMVPVRFISETMGASVKYTNPTAPVIVEFDNTKLTFYLNSKSIEKNVNGIITSEKMDVPAQLIKGKTFIPLRAVGESIGWEVEYIDADHSIIISQNKLSKAELDEQTTLAKTKLKFENIKITGIKFEQSSAAIMVGDKDTLKPIITPSNATLANVIVYQSSNPEIATISSNGVVKGIAPGVTEITAVNNNGSIVGTLSLTVLDDLDIYFMAYEDYWNCYYKIDSALESFANSGYFANDLNYSYLQTSSFRNDVAELRTHTESIRGITNTFPSLSSNSFITSINHQMYTISDKLASISYLANKSTLDLSTKNEIVSEFNLLVDALDEFFNIIYS